MKVLVKAQHTPEWHSARASRVTASRIGDAIARPGTKRRAGYLLELALDLEGVPNIDGSDEHLAPWHLNGVMWESWARGWYAWQPSFPPVTETGFVVSDAYDWLGCSPDGLIEDDGGLEIKCHLNLRLQRASIDHIPRATLDQMHLSMFICDRQWWDLLNFWRDDPMGLEQGHIIRIHRDPARIDYLVERAATFYAEVLDHVEQRKRS